MNAYRYILPLDLRNFPVHIGLTNNFGINYSLFVLLALISIAAYLDLRSHKIPNILTFSGMVAALTYFSALNGFDGLLFSLKGIGLGIGLLLVPYLMGGMGAGDAKLMGVVGGFLGAKGVFGAFILSAAVGGIYALMLILIYRSKFTGYLDSFWQRSLIFLSTRRYIPEPEDARNRRPRLCYGLAIALGTAIYMALSNFGLTII